jgi:enoyl-CoA hydratase/carnithine racemase
VADGIATLAFNRPEVYNALDEEMIVAFVRTARPWRTTRRCAVLYCAARV